MYFLNYIYACEYVCGYVHESASAHRGQKGGVGSPGPRARMVSARSRRTVYMYHHAIFPARLENLKGVFRLREDVTLDKDHSFTFFNMSIKTKNKKVC